MNPILFAQIPGLWTTPILLGAVAVWRLLPVASPRPRWVGALLGVAALASAGMTLLRPSDGLVNHILFCLFAGGAIGGAVCMITSRNPVYSGLWFVVVTLCVCGLFLLCAAPFLAAAMVIVYAGAIIVTFLFLIMLAQQAVGSAVYDQRARQPLAATLAGFLVLGGVLAALQQWTAPVAWVSDPSVPPPDVSDRSVSPPDVSEPSLPQLPRTNQTPPVNSLSRQRPDEEMGTVQGLGRTLFGPYLYAVEMAGTLLLVACIGAIAIDLRRSRRDAE